MGRSNPEIIDKVIMATYHHLDPAWRVGDLSELLSAFMDEDYDCFDDLYTLDHLHYVDVRKALMNLGWFQ